LYLHRQDRQSQGLEKPRGAHLSARLMGLGVLVGKEFVVHALGVGTQRVDPRRRRARPLLRWLRDQPAR
jgi:hypothetical protein